MNRTFHSRTRWDQLFYVLLVAFVCFFMIWIKQAILAVILSILLIILIERIIHTEYILTADNKLIIKSGRFLKEKKLDLDQINDIEHRTTTKFGSFYIASYILITYNKNKHLSLTPANAQRFIDILIKKKEHYIEEEDDYDEE